MSRVRKGNQVDKKMSTSETLSYIFAKPQLLQELVESSDLAGDSARQMGFSRTKFEILKNDFLRTHAADDQARYRAVYDVKNLQQCNLIVDVDEGNKRITFSDHLIALIRDTDVRITRELTSVEYRGMLEEMKRLRDSLREASLTHVDEEYYTDLRHAMFNHLRKIRSAIRTNEVKFGTISMELAEMSSGITHDKVVYGKAKSDMYRKASKLYERHIKPTVEFLDKNSKIEGGNLFVVLGDVREIFINRQEHEYAEELLLSSLNLGNSYKPIERISLEVKKFLRISRENARAFNAFENIHSKINSALDELKSGNMSKKTLAKNTELVDMFDFHRNAEGARVLNAQTPLMFSTNPVFFKNLQLEMEQRLAIRGKIEESELVDVEIAHSSKKIRKDVSDNERAKILYKILSEVDVRETGDVYALLHDRLSGVLPQYSFFDLNAAKRGMESRMQTQKSGLSIKATGFKKSIDINGKNYQYYVRKVKGAENAN